MGDGKEFSKDVEWLVQFIPAYYSKELKKLSKAKLQQKFDAVYADWLSKMESKVTS